MKLIDDVGIRGRDVMIIPSRRLEEVLFSKYLRID